MYKLLRMETKDKLVSGAIGILAIATIVLTAGLASQENVYACMEREIARICDKLSAINKEGLQTRCYYDDTYKVCDSGWIKYTKTESVKINTPEIKDYHCNDETLIKECVAEDGSVILRVKA